EKLGANLSINYQSGAAFNVLDTPETRDILRVDDYWLLNGGVSYDFSDKATVRLAVTNLLDEDPPFPAFGGGIGAYDILGRRYNLAFEGRYGPSAGARRNRRAEDPLLPPAGKGGIPINPAAGRSVVPRRWRFPPSWRRLLPGPAPAPPRCAPDTSARCADG